MNTNLKSFIIGAIFTVFIVVGIGGVIYGAWRMGQPGPVAPTVPQRKPQAAELTTTPACTLKFTVPEIPAPKCDSSCSISSDCPSDLVCSNGKCRNNACTDQQDCKCPPPPAPTCNSACNDSAGCPNDLACSSGRCRNPSCTDRSDCKCPPPLKVCNETCTVNADCQSQYICAGGNCRNPSCITQPSCTCPPPTTYVPPPAIVYTHKVCQNYACVTVNGRAADTCSSDASCQPVAKPPVIYQAGIEWPTVMAILGGVGLLVVGLLVL